MKLQFNRKYATIAVYTVLVFAACLMLVIFAFRIEIFKSVLSKIIEVSSPIIWGFVIAYLINPLMKRFERLFGRLINRKKTHRGLVRGLSVACSILLLLSLLTGLIAAIIPEVIQNIQSIADSVQDPSFIAGLKEGAENLVDRLTDQTAFFRQHFKLDFADLQEMLLNMISQFELNIGKVFAKDGLIASITSGFMAVLSTIKNAFLGVIVSIYLLYSKEKFFAQSKKLICAVCKPDSSQRIFKFVRNVNHKFIHYFTGVALDCSLIGVVTFLFMTVTGMPYAPLISVLLALTNAIPIFGPFIGGVPSVLLLMLFSPVKGLIFGIFIIVVQQIDGNIIAPKILGDQLGLSAFWIMAAVFIGGGLFGFVGMIVASPVFAVLYSLCSEYVSARLERKGLPVLTESYMPPEWRRNPKPEKTPAPAAAPEQAEAKNITDPSDGGSEDPS